jgi:Plasmid maintenance system killer protein
VNRKAEKQKLRRIFFTLGGIPLLGYFCSEKDMIMIKSFGDKITEKISNGERVRQVSSELEKGAVKKLDMINFVTGLEQLPIPPGNRLERLSGDLAGFYSIRINDQFRIIFKWTNDHVYEVQLTDYCHVNDALSFRRSLYD